MYKFFFNPIIATNIILLILSLYLFILHKNNIFDENFFHFGPGTNEQNTITFIHTKVDSWNMVWLVWIIGFTTTALQKYYWTAVSDYIYLNIRNPSIKKLNCPKSSLTFVVFFRSFISISLSVLSMFTYLTGQLQFILPSLITSLIMIAPLDIHYLNQKKFTKVKNKLFHIS